jgi:hypothetical protein
MTAERFSILFPLGFHDRPPGAPPAVEPCRRSWWSRLQEALGARPCGLEVVRCPR